MNSYILPSQQFLGQVSGVDIPLSRICGAYRSANNPSLMRVKKAAKRSPFLRI